MLTTRRLMLMLATGLVTLAAAPAVFASTAEVSNGAAIYDVDLQNPFVQNVTVTFADNRYTFTDTGGEPRAAMNAKSGCSRGDGKTYNCTGSGVNRVFIETENLDDVATVGSGVTVPVSFSMGQGGDSATGGPAADKFLGGLAVGLGNDTFEGKEGDDIFFGGPNSDSMNGGPGSDTLDLSARVLRQTVTLDGERNDGDPTDLASLDSAALSGADSLTEVENIIGGSARDTLIGDDKVNRLAGGDSEDTLEGRGGADTFEGGNGNDTINARSSAAGAPDPDAKIDCGGGTDRVTADAEDVVSSNCEDIDCAGCEISKNNQPPANPANAAIDPPGGANDADEGKGPGGGGALIAGGQALPPEVQIVSGGVVPLKSNGRIPVRIICIYRADRCKGSLTLKAKTKISVKVGRKTKTFAKNTTIAKADLAPIRWGNSAPVQLKANALFRAILPLLRKPNTKVTATLLSQDAAGGASAPTARATGDLIVAAKPKGKRK